MKKCNVHIALDSLTNKIDKYLKILKYKKISMVHYI